MQITELRTIINAYNVAKGPFRRAFRTDATCIKNVKKLLDATAGGVDDNISDCDVMNCFLGPKNRPTEGSESQGAFKAIVAKIFPGKDADVIIRDYFSSSARPISQDSFEEHKNNIMRAAPLHADSLPAGATTASVSEDAAASEIQRLKAELAEANGRLQLDQTVLGSRVTHVEEGNAELLASEDTADSDLIARVKKVEDATAGHLASLNEIAESARATAATVILMTEQLELVFTEKERMTAEKTALLAQIGQFEAAQKGLEARAVALESTNASLVAQVAGLQERNAALLQQLQDARAASKEVSSAASPSQSDVSEHVSSQVTTQTLFAPVTAAVAVEASSSEQKLSSSPTLGKAANAD